MANQNMLKQINMDKLMKFDTDAQTGVSGLDHMTDIKKVKSNRTYRS